MDKNKKIKLLHKYLSKNKDLKGILKLNQYITENKLNKEYIYEEEDDLLGNDTYDNLGFGKKGKIKTGKANYISGDNVQFASTSSSKKFNINSRFVVSRVGLNFIKRTLGVTSEKNIHDITDKHIYGSGEDSSKIFKDIINYLNEEPWEVGGGKRVTFSNIPLRDYDLRKKIIDKLNPEYLQFFKKYDLYNLILNNPYDVFKRKAIEKLQTSNKTGISQLLTNYELDKISKEEFLTLTKKEINDLYSNSNNNVSNSEKIALEFLIKIFAEKEISIKDFYVKYENSNIPDEFDFNIESDEKLKSIYEWFKFLQKKKFISFVSTAKNKENYYSNIFIFVTQLGIDIYRALANLRPQDYDIPSKSQILQADKLKKDEEEDEYNNDETVEKIASTKKLQYKKDFKLLKPINDKLNGLSRLVLKIIIQYSYQNKNKKISYLELENKLSNLSPSQIQLGLTKLKSLELIDLSVKPNINNVPQQKLDGSSDDLLGDLIGKSNEKTSEKTDDNKNDNLLDPNIEVISTKNKKIDTKNAEVQGDSVSFSGGNIDFEAKDPYEYEEKKYKVNKDNINELKPFLINIKHKDVISNEASPIIYNYCTSNIDETFSIDDLLEFFSNNMEDRMNRILYPFKSSKYVVNNEKQKLIPLDNLEKFLSPEEIKSLEDKNLLNPFTENKNNLNILKNSLYNVLSELSNKNIIEIDDENKINYEDIKEILSKLDESAQELGYKDFSSIPMKIDKLVYDEIDNNKYIPQDILSLFYELYDGKLIFKGNNNLSNLKNILGELFKKSPNALSSKNIAKGLMDKLPFESKIEIKSIKAYDIFNSDNPLESLKEYINKNLISLEEKNLNPDIDIAYKVLSFDEKKLWTKYNLLKTGLTTTEGIESLSTKYRSQPFPENPKDKKIFDTKQQLLGKLKKIKITEKGKKYINTEINDENRDLIKFLKGINSNENKTFIENIYNNLTLDKKTTIQKIKEFTLKLLSPLSHNKLVEFVNTEKKDKYSQTYEKKFIVNNNEYDKLKEFYKNKIETNNEKKYSNLLKILKDKDKITIPSSTLSKILNNNEIKEIEEMGSIKTSNGYSINEDGIEFIKSVIKNNLNSENNPSIILLNRLKSKNKKILSIKDLENIFSEEDIKYLENENIIEKYLENEDNINFKKSILLKIKNKLLEYSTTEEGDKLIENLKYYFKNKELDPYIILEYGLKIYDYELLRIIYNHDKKIDSEYKEYISHILGNFYDIKNIKIINRIIEKLKELKYITLDKKS